MTNSRRPKIRLGGGNTYPTHSIGPLLQWFGDRVTAVSCVGTGRHTDPEHQIDETVLLLARTSRRTLLKVRLELLSNRPHLMNYYSVQGTGGCYEAARGPGLLGRGLLGQGLLGQGLLGQGLLGQGLLGRVYIVQRSPEGSWQSLEEYVDEFLPPRYREIASDAGHWGADTWPVREFIDAIANREHPSLDVYAALNMTLPGVLSERSFMKTVPGRRRYLTRVCGRRGSGPNQAEKLPWPSSSRRVSRVPP